MNLPNPSVTAQAQTKLFAPTQQPCLRAAAVQAAVMAMGVATDEERGAVFTKPVIVDFILDLLGYTSEKPLWQMRLLEPSFGGGDFLVPAVRRLLVAWKHQGHSVPDLSNAIVAVEIAGIHFQSTSKALRALLLEYQVPDVDSVLQHWLHHDDFLLTQLDGLFDLVIGNPPYVRQERIAPVLLEQYRALYATMYDRADLYVPFFERSLSLLRPGGRLGFICANRWQKNKYGGPLRKYVATGFHLETHVDLVGCPAFSANVIAYPAITIIRATPPQAPTAVVQRPPVERSHLEQLAADLRTHQPRPDVTIVHGVCVEDAPWLLDEPARLAILRRLESRHPVIEAAGCKVGIGVASGCDKVYIAKADALPIETERKLPLILARETRSGAVQSTGYALANPYDEHGQLVNLDDWPLYAAYMRTHQASLTARNVAKRSGSRWYRTIDRVQPGLRTAEKLLIPDIKDTPHVVYEPGERYPHHNLYWVTSDTYDIRSLQVLLQSPVAALFIRAYCVEMAGGFLRFQAQYLRRIPVPRWGTLTDETRGLLRDAIGQPPSSAKAKAAVAAAYGLSEEDCSLLYETGPHADQQ